LNIIIDMSYTYISVEACIANNIAVLVIPSGLSYIFQPCDVGVFSPMKKKWRKVLTNFFRMTLNRMALDKNNFPTVLSDLWDQLESQWVIGGNISLC